jgi:serine/threonine protein phosphatase 1
VTELIKRFAANTTGRDFVVGDLHGCFDKFNAELVRIGFDRQVDRMFSVGDLGDRGAKSKECAELLYEPWFHAVRGNHEQMAVEAATDRNAMILLLMNGGDWFHELSCAEQQEIQRLYADLPLAIEVETKEPDGRFGILHAECPVADWNELEAALTGPNAESFAQWCIWNRERISNRNDAPVANVRAVICGHTPVRDAVRLGNHVFIDTGAVFGHALTIAQLTIGEIIKKEAA